MTRRCGLEGFASCFAGRSVTAPPAHSPRWIAELLYSAAVRSADCCANTAVGNEMNPRVASATTNLCCGLNIRLVLLRVKKLVVADVRLLSVELWGASCLVQNASAAPRGCKCCSIVCNQGCLGIYAGWQNSGCNVVTGKMSDTATAQVQSQRCSTGSLSAWKVLMRRSRVPLDMPGCVFRTPAQGRPKSCLTLHERCGGRAACACESCADHGEQQREDQDQKSNPDAGITNERSPAVKRGYAGIADDLL